MDDAITTVSLMDRPHPLSWPNRMNALGVKTLNLSLPASGLFSNVARATQMYIRSPNSLYLIDVCLMDHLAKEDKNYQARNFSFFPQDSIERKVTSLSQEQQLFIINETKKFLIQIGMRFKFIMFGNPLSSWENPNDQAPSDYIRRLRVGLLEPFSLPYFLKEYFLFDTPYLHFFEENLITEFSHVTDERSVNTIARFVVDKILASYEICETHE